MLLLTCSDGNDPIKEIEKPKEENPFITLKKANIDFTNEGGSEAITIESNVTWTTKSSAGWCTVTSSSGNKSTASITLTAAANEDYDNRSCTVTIESGGITKTITVNQGENLGLLITQDRYELSNEEATIKVEVKANVDFEVAINDAWITKIETRGLTTSEMEFKIAENDTYGNRDGFITINQKDGDMVSTITIFQSQEDAIILSEKDFDISSEAQSVEVEVKTNIDYEIIIPEDAKDWVSHTTTRALRTETVVLDIAENTDYDRRGAEIYVKDKVSDLQDTIIINQNRNQSCVYFVKEMGTLEAVLNQTQKDTITTMIVEGEINKADFEVMKKKIPNLRHLDLKDVRCENDKIPSEAIGGKYDSNEKIRTVILPLNIKTIGKMAFAYCSSLTGFLNFPDGLHDIEEEAFFACSGITGTMTFSEGLKTIGRKAFSACSGFSGSLVLPESLKIIDDQAFSDCHGISGSLILPDNITKIGKGAFANCSSLNGSLSLPSKLKVIEEQIFYNCKELRGPLRIPDGVTIIERQAFYGCEFLRGTLILPDLLKEIGNEAFSGCYNFTGNLNFPDGLITIGQKAFLGCNQLSGSLIFPDGLTTIGEEAFVSCYGLNGSLIFSDSLKKLGAGAFQGCYNLTGSINIPDGITTIERQVFAGCKKLNGTLKIPNNVDKIGLQAFFNCEKLRGALILPSKLTIIEEGAFDGCNNFTGSLNLPSELTTIGRHAFRNCIGFIRLKFGDNITSIDEDAFLYCINITDNVVFPISLKTLKEGVFMGCDKVEAFQFPHSAPLKYYPNILPSEATVKVPTSAVATYKSTNGWKNYNIVGY